MSKLSKAWGKQIQVALTVFLLATVDRARVAGQSLAEGDETEQKKDNWLHRGAVLLGTVAEIIKKRNAAALVTARSNGMTNLQPIERRNPRMRQHVINRH